MTGLYTYAVKHWKGNCLAPTFRTLRLCVSFGKNSRGFSAQVFQVDVRRTPRFRRSRPDVGKRLSQRRYLRHAPLARQRRFESRGRFHVAVLLKYLALKKFSRQLDSVWRRTLLGSQTMRGRRSREHSLWTRRKHLRFVVSAHRKDGSRRHRWSLVSESSVG